ncbi:hypothetical protein EJ110_NYTH40323 [Nymphaea thermarum]|nr:hypothetical protein EJ110_NYTH40323 [Nymphaea thermarum]
MEVVESSEQDVRLVQSETRWVDGSEIDSESSKWSAEDAIMRDSELGGVRRRLTKKPKRIDSFDVEAMGITSYNAHHKKDPSYWHLITLAFQTLGVVYGDMGTSPLYVFSDVFSKVPIKSEIDVLGALSLVMYTIAIIPFAKYVFIVLKANDNGEGGTFALYSLICRYAKVNRLPNRQPADERISSYKLKVPTPEMERALNIKEMMSAVGGLQGAVNGFGEDAVVVVSIIILIALFSIQRFGTSKVAFLFAPALAIWFFYLGSAGLYNICKYNIAVVKAFNPCYIYYFFKRNSRQAWSALGGCVLCITGAEAMFADLGHFSVASIQIAFTFVVFPCLLLAYMGQAAYLIENPTSVGRIFYDSVPSIAEVIVMMVSTTLVTVVMLLIWQKNLFLALCFPVVFGSVELIYLSAVLSKIKEGGWLPLAFATCFLCVMFIWNYGSVLKYESEVREKISVDFLLDLGSTLGTIRVPGIGLVYNELVQGVPSIFGQFLLNLPAIHSTIVFVCIKYVPVPVVPQEERFLFKRVCPKDYHMFRCIARYGYKDVRKEDHDSFEQLLIESLEKFLRKEAHELALEFGAFDLDFENETVVSRSREAPSGVGELQIPLMADQRGGELGVEPSESSSENANGSALPTASMPSSDEDPALEYELSALREATDSGVTYLLAHGDVRARKDSLFIKKLVINYLYAFLRNNCRAGAANLSVPHMNIIEVAMTYMV